MTVYLDPLRRAIREMAHCAEPAAVAALLASSSLTQSQRNSICRDAAKVVTQCRSMKHQAGTLDAFLQEFGLSNDEGIALMCLAESLLRVRNDATADRLIAEKINAGDWASHKGQSDSRFVNASVWGLMLTGRVVRLDEEVSGDTPSWMRRLVSSLGEPVVRRAILQAMRIMGGQYVLGRSIDEAMRTGKADNPAATRFSFDMLGEGARTEKDATRYFDAYASAIQEISNTTSANRVEQADGISVKLSALHARYEYRQHERVMAELYPRVKALAVLAKEGGIGFSIDAEEADRLDLSLDIFESLAQDPELTRWDGLGFVLQAYQKRALPVARWLIALGRQNNRRLMVRLVKGAYWDGEIKHAQEQGYEDYPVFTRKCHTDVSYEICAQVLLEASDIIYSQFATHNAHTVATIQALAGPTTRFEFQRLHGMGQLLYNQVLSQSPNVAVRVYAPVGSHRDLLPYLVRRLLENGANSSFVNRFLDARVAPQELLKDPMFETQQYAVARHSRIPIPRDLYQDEALPWRNALGMDLADQSATNVLDQAVADCRQQEHLAGPIVSGDLKTHAPRAAHAVRNPADHQHAVGVVSATHSQDIEDALLAAVDAQRGWDGKGASARADYLDRAAALLEEHMPALIALISLEAGRTLDDGLSEVREAIDFCRYYAQQARGKLGHTVVLPGPTGEVNELSYSGRGVFLCISPWNFPLAIFVGQVAAALAAGNTVIAKPAEQTPLIAARAVQLLHQAGVPVDALHLLPGDGAEVGGALVSDPRIAGVAFTGSTATARLINQQLASRLGPIAPLIAETGGLNVMIVDGTALPEQVVDDVVTSAFRSAGQRCSALRVLYVQDDIADDIIAMLSGAMRELSIGAPDELRTDIGPVIDRGAQAMLERHVQRMDSEATLLASCNSPGGAGTFIAPRVYEIERLSQLAEEVFGPILHLIRFKSNELESVLGDINASGYGLTLGVHSRIDGFARDVFAGTRVGNTYINRNMVGAVVGVNPFGGQGLSGTGPKAGGPNYLMRFATERTRTDNVVAKGGNTQLFSLEEYEGLEGLEELAASDGRAPATTPLEQSPLAIVVG